MRMPSLHARLFFSLSVIDFPVIDLVASNNYFQVQTLLTQMQDKFQNMSDQIITRNILEAYFF